MAGHRDVEANTPAFYRGCGSGETTTANECQQCCKRTEHHWLGALRSHAALEDNWPCCPGRACLGCERQCLHEVKAEKENLGPSRPRTCQGGNRVGPPVYMHAE